MEMVDCLGRTGLWEEQEERTMGAGIVYTYVCMKLGKNKWCKTGIINCKCLHTNVL